MQEWSIVVIRLQTILTRVEEAYDHVTLVSGQDDSAAHALGRIVWTVRGELQAAVKQARQLRDRDSAVAEKGGANVH